MRALRRNLLADPQNRLGGLAGPHPLREMRQPDDGAKPQVSDRKGPGALTISLMLSAPDRVDSAGSQ